MAPKINWDVNLEASQVPGRDRYIVSQPSYFEAASDIIAGTDHLYLERLPDFQTIDAFAPVLGDDIFQAWFEFYRAGSAGYRRTPAALEAGCQCNQRKHG